MRFNFQCGACCLHLWEMRDARIQVLGESTAWPAYHNVRFARESVHGAAELIERTGIDHVNRNTECDAECNSDYRKRNSSRCVRERRNDRRVERRAPGIDGGSHLVSRGFKPSADSVNARCAVAAAAAECVISIPTAA